MTKVYEKFKCEAETGQERVVQEHFKKGQRIGWHPDGVIIFTEDAVVDVVERFTQKQLWYLDDTHGEWRHDRYKWETLRPKNAPVPEIPKPLEPPKKIFLVAFVRP